MRSVQVETVYVNVENVVVTYVVLTVYVTGDVIAEVLIVPGVG
jgi:hypothetical protein